MATVTENPGTMCFRFGSQSVRCYSASRRSCRSQRDPSIPGTRNKSLWMDWVKGWAMEMAWELETARAMEMARELETARAKEMGRRQQC